MYDVVIIGGGVIGCLTARELAKYKISICLLEKQSDVSAGTSKANSSIVHAGFDATPETNKAKFNARGNFLMEKVCSELGVHFKRNGSLVLAFEDEQLSKLIEMLEKGKKNNVPQIGIIPPEKVWELEPNISREVKAALLAETGGIVCPFGLTHHAAENAVQNGVTILTSCGVTAISKNKDHFKLQTPKCEISAKYVLNAAGLFADEIAKMAGDMSFSIYPRKGEYMLYDKRKGNTVRHTIFQTPGKLGKGTLITPTVDGNLLVGPNAENIEDKTNLDTTPRGLDFILQGAQKSVPDISKRDVITSFVGLRAISDTDDFVLGKSQNVENLIHLAGIQSPGLSSSPAIAEYAADLINELEGGLELREDYNPILKERPIISEITDDELQELVTKNPSYGRIICRCETVSEAEIINSINASPPAQTIDGVKRRTRAGAGRCQGGFCMPKVLEILSKEQGIPYTDIVKNEKGSYILTTRTKGASK